MALVELVDEFGEHATALVRIAYHRGGRRQVGNDTVLEVKGQMRVGGEVQ